MCSVATTEVEQNDTFPVTWHDPNVTVIPPYKEQTEYNSSGEVIGYTSHVWYKLSLEDHKKSLTCSVTLKTGHVSIESKRFRITSKSCTCVCVCVCCLLYTSDAADDC